MYAHIIMRATLAFLWLLHAAHGLLPAAWHSQQRRSAHAPRRGRALFAQQIDEEIGMASSEWLSAHADEQLAAVLEALLASCAQIASKVRTASCDSTSCFSPIMGDEEEGEMAVDVLANELLVSNLRATKLVSVISSESDGIEDSIPDAQSGFSVALDPLSGNSILDTNFAVGTMFSVWRGNSLQNVTGGELAAAGACVYGPRTTWTVALRELPAVHEFLLVEEASAAGGRWAKSNAFAAMREGRLFAPANYRSSATHEGYARLIEHWQREEFSLRYTGAAVVDVVQLLVKASAAAAPPPPWPPPRPPRPPSPSAP